MIRDELHKFPPSPLSLYFNFQCFPPFFKINNNINIKILKMIIINILRLHSSISVKIDLRVTAVLSIDYLDIRKAVLLFRGAIISPCSLQYKRVLWPVEVDNCAFGHFLPWERASCHPKTTWYRRRRVYSSCRYAQFFIISHCKPSPK